VRVGWEQKRFEDLIESNVIGLTKSSREQAEDKALPYVKMNNITRDNRFDFSMFTCVDATDEEVRKFSLCAGDFLFNTRNSYELVGKSCIYESDSDDVVLFNNNIMRIRFKSGFDAKFVLLAFLSGSVADELNALKSGTTNVSAIYFKNLKSLLIPVPPLPEQERIVAILDEAFAAIATATANAEKNLAHARELFESELNRVFSQKGDGWVEKKLIDLTAKIGSGATPRGGQAAYKEEGISLIRSLNVHDRRFTQRKLAFIDDGQASKLSNVVVEEGDVLFNITGASIARCCMAPAEFLPARVNQHVAILRPRRQEISTEFLCYLMTSMPYKAHLLGIGDEGGSTRQAITKAQLQNLVIAFPSTLSEQIKATSELDKLAAKAKHLEALYQQKLTALAELKQSILQKAFAGELTHSQSGDWRSRGGV